MRHAAWETDSEDEDETALPAQPSLSSASSGRIVRVLDTELERLEGVGDVVAVAAAENDDGEEYWLLQVTQAPSQLAAPLSLGGVHFEGREFAVAGRWLERRRGGGAGPCAYLLGEDGAAYTRLLFGTDVELHQSGSSSVYAMSLHEDERICAAKRALPLHLLDDLSHPPPLPLLGPLPPVPL